MSKQHRADLLLLVSTLIWGSTFPIVKGYLETNSPLFYTGLRFLLAALALFLCFYRRLKRIPPSTLKKGTVLGLLLFTGFALQTVGQQYTSASKSAFFTGTLVVLTPLVHAGVQKIFGLRRRVLKVGNILGVGAAACGLYLLTSPKGSDFNEGDALTLGCALLFAVYIVYLDFASTEPDKLQLTYVQLLLCALLGFASAFLFEDIRSDVSAGSVVSLLYLTIFATVLAMWFQNRFQGDTTPTRAAVVFSMEPVIAAIFSYFMRGEVLAAAGVLGAIVIVGGVLVSEVSDTIPFLNRSLQGASRSS